MGRGPGVGDRKRGGRRWEDGVRRGRRHGKRLEGGLGSRGGGKVRGGEVKRKKEGVRG